MGATSRMAFFIGTIALAGLSRTAAADVLLDSIGPREMAVGEAMRGSAVGSTAVTMNPSGAALNREVVFEGGYGYRTRDSAGLLSASGCDSTSALAGCYFYAYLGRDLGVEGMGRYGVHTAGASLARQLGPAIAIGTTLRYLHVGKDAMQGFSGHGFNWDLGATVRASELISVGAVGYNLWGAETTEFPRAVGGGVQLRPIAPFAVSFDGRWALAGAQQGKARIGGGAEYFFSRGQAGVPIRAGALYDQASAATYISAGLGFSALAYGLDVGGRKQIRNGDEWALIASLRVYGPRVANNEPFLQQ